MAPIGAFRTALDWVFATGVDWVFATGVDFVFALADVAGATATRRTKTPAAPIRHQPPAPHSSNGCTSNSACLRHRSPPRLAYRLATAGPGATLVPPNASVDPDPLYFTYVESLFNHFGPELRVRRLPKD